MLQADEELGDEASEGEGGEAEEDAAGEEEEPEGEEAGGLLTPQAAYAVSELNQVGAYPCCLQPASGNGRHRQWAGGSPHGTAPGAVGG